MPGFQWPGRKKEDKNKGLQINVNLSGKQNTTEKIDSNHSTHEGSIRRNSLEGSRRSIEGSRRSMRSFARTGDVSRRSIRTSGRSSRALEYHSDSDDELSKRLERLRERRKAMSKQGRRYQSERNLGSATRTRSSRRFIIESSDYSSSSSSEESDSDWEDRRPTRRGKSTKTKSQRIVKTRKTSKKKKKAKNKQDGMSKRKSQRKIVLVLDSQ